MKANPSNFKPMQFPDQFSEQQKLDSTLMMPLYYLHTDLWLAFIVHFVASSTFVLHENAVCIVYLFFSEKEARRIVVQF